MITAISIAQVKWLAIGAAAFFFAEPVSANSCDEEGIAAMSVEEAATSIWTHSDVIGFGYVSTIDTPERLQQFIDMVVTLKGTPTRYDYAPLRIGRLMWEAPGMRRLTSRPDEIVFLTLVRTERGYVIPVCRDLVLDKDRPAIIRLLAARARRETGSGPAH